MSFMPNHNNMYRLTITLIQMHFNFNLSRLDNSSLECLLIHSLARDNIVTPRMYDSVHETCIETFVEHYFEPSFCERNPDTCEHHERNAKHRSFTNRRLLKGRPPPTNYPTPGPTLPTKAPTHNPTSSPSPAPSYSPTNSMENLISTTFYKYPSGLSINLNQAATDTGSTQFFSQYSLVDMDTYTYSIYSQIGARDLNYPEQILTKFKFTPEVFRGFIFENNRLRFIVKRISKLSQCTFTVPKLIQSGYTYYERRFTPNEHNVYIPIYFGFVERSSSGYHRKGVENYILMDISEMISTTPESMEDLCSQIPRCLGYIPTIGLVSSNAIRELPLVKMVEADVGFQYFEKETGHAIFYSFKRNVVLFSIILTLYALVVFLAIFYGKGIRKILFLWINPFLGNVQKIGVKNFKRKVKNDNKRIVRQLKKQAEDRIANADDEQEYLIKTKINVNF